MATAPRNLDPLLDVVLSEAGAEPVIAGLPAGVEAVRRGDRLFLLNHTDKQVRVHGHVIEPFGARIDIV